MVNTQSVANRFSLVVEFSRFKSCISRFLSKKNKKNILNIHFFHQHLLSEERLVNEKIALRIGVFVGTVQFNCT